MAKASAPSYVAWTTIPSENALSLSLYDASIPGYLHMLRNLSANAGNSFDEQYTGSFAAGSAWVLAEMWNGFEQTELRHIPLRWLRLRSG